jgi:CRISPR-associated endoribonuclease Cas6
MPGIILHVFASAPVRLPLADNHIIQAMIYDLLQAEPEILMAFHNEGVSEEGNRYKLFTFSRLKARHRLDSGRVIYSGPGQIEIRAADNTFTDALCKAAYMRKSIRLGDGLLTLTAVEKNDITVFTDTLEITMRSPVTVHRREESGFVRYPAPEEILFEELIDGNFRRKYEAFTGEKPEEGIRIRPLGDVRRTVTSYKGTKLCAYYGKFCLQGKADYLAFLYNAGLGARTGQGFGMFEIDRISRAPSGEV